MSSDNSKTFNKSNLDHYFYELAKTYKKLGGKKMPAEIILIGGAAIIENYGFRDMTTDIDAIIQASSVMDNAIKQVGDQFELPYGWLNSDFMKTSSYSKGLIKYASFYKLFNQILTVRTISAEYLIAMKLRSGRKYKNDLSDILGILAEHESKGDLITFERIDTAIKNLYGSWDTLPEDSVKFLNDALSNGDYIDLYSIVRQEEAETKEILVDFQDNYPKVLTENNMDDILKRLKEKRNGK